MPGPWRTSTNRGRSGGRSARARQHHRPGRTPGCHSRQPARQPPRNPLGARHRLPETSHVDIGPGYQDLRLSSVCRRPLANRVQAETCSTDPCSGDRRSRCHWRLSSCGRDKMLSMIADNPCIKIVLKIVSYLAAVTCGADGGARCGVSGKLISLVQTRLSEQLRMGWWCVGFNSVFAPLRGASPPATCSTGRWDVALFRSLPATPVGRPNDLSRFRRDRL